MISYNPKQWSRILFDITKKDTLVKMFPALVFVCVYTAIIAYIELEYLHLNDDHWLKATPQMHGLLGFAISMLLVFRTNTAYDRWWEGRRLWGILVNNSRNLCIKLKAFLPALHTEDRAFFRKLIPQFAFELIGHLQAERTRLALDENPHPEIPDFNTNEHVPGQIAALMYAKAGQLASQKVISGEQLIILNHELQGFLEICGACERIKNTPIPYSYSSFIKKFIFIYVLTLPFGFVFTLGYYAIAVVAFVFYVLGSLELIAEEIEDPFGKDENDLPMHKLATTIQMNVNELLP